MKFLSNEEEALKYLKKAAEVALNSTCLRSKCGSVIVKNNEIIGSGFNSPPNNDENQRRCLSLKESYHKKITDKTCCVHAEQRAIMDTLKKNPDKIQGSRLYFVRLKGNEISKSGKPYCTICSKMALDSGIKEFVLWHEQGICVYDTEEYNELSFKFNPSV
ncbi:MAG: hypothetical protein KKA65_00340 [Nanoarchaeota archaeon]|nr:hypothetical protein [Nanoarchaeota archaeon]MBU4352423.1 hypothetical protein [Nanoarchaeota archaeon]MBU4455933.1 hypothetical protein [Nanoarchaeota archaeon]MCG2720364.1 hypothetical protein [Nanoarchaeota archaeon]